MPSILETIGPRSDTAPLTYTLAEQGTVDVMSIFAHFDGAGAGGTFRPVVTIRSQSGAILARGFPSDSVAAGDSADVTFAPFLRGEAASSGASGIQFDTDNQGGYLLVTTNDPAPGYTSGLVLHDAQDFGGVGIASTGFGGSVLIEAGDGTTTGGTIDLAAYTDGGGDGAINFLSEGPTVVEAVSSLQLACSGGDVRVKLGETWSLTVETHTGVILLEVREAGPTFVMQVKDTAGAPLFRVADDGSLHGKTGQTLTFDL